MPKLGRRAFLGLAGSVVLVAPGHANQEEGSSWQDSTGDMDVDVRLGRAGAYSFQELFSMSRTRLRALARAAVFIDSADPEKNVLVAGLGTEAS